MSPAYSKAEGYRRGGLISAALLALSTAGCATQGPASGGAAKAAPVVAQPPAVAAVHPTRPVMVLAAPTEVELQAGIQLAHIGVTASGGLVDARFKVLDAVKVSTLMSNPANVPMLVAGDKPPLMAPHHAMKGSRFVKDQVFIILYPNTRAAVQPGAEVTAAIGQVRIGPVTAQ